MRQPPRHRARRGPGVSWDPAPAPASAPSNKPRRAARRSPSLLRAWRSCGLRRLAFGTRQHGVDALHEGGELGHVFMKETGGGFVEHVALVVEQVLAEVDVGF